MIKKAASLEKHLSGCSHFQKNKLASKQGVEDKTPPKRKASYCEISKVKTLSKSLDQSKTRKGFEKVNYKMGPQVLSFEMEEQRNNQMTVIMADRRLSNYYFAFKKLFVIIFQASHYLMQNMFKLSISTYRNRQVAILCLLFYKKMNEWNMPFLQTLMMLASNTIHMSSSPNEFQRRIDTVARKVVIHNKNKQRIQNAFLNANIQRIWEKSVEANFQDEQTEIFIQDQFQSVEERLCFIDIKEFVVNKLCTTAFGNDLKKYCPLEEIDYDLNFDFKFEFLLTEEFSFQLSSQQVKKEINSEDSKKGKRSNACLVM